MAAGKLDRLKAWYPTRLFQAYGESQAGNYAAALAFNAFMSMFPLMLGLLAVLGLVIRDPHAQQHFETTVVGFFPSDAHSALTNMLRSVRQHAGLLGLVGILGLLWSGSSLFTSMEFTLGKVFGARQRDFLRQRLMALMMTGIFVVAIVLSVVVNAAVGLVHGLPFLGPVVGALVWIGFMTTIYRVVPNRTFTLADLWPGALLAGLLMEVLTLLWPLYTGLSHGFNTYGSTFALFFLLATWLYFFSQFILLGAVANRMRMGTPIVEGAQPGTQEGMIETQATEASDRHGDRQHAGVS
ncbi:MAG TPA: YihY/virulence factor BrkB family protein [Candidatus Acidoferrum sp.]|nr:YihY/virulence factor BrkB family protein [Candidatus Acidoferrum sp.]